MNSVEIVPSIFQGGGQEGDFRWMIDQPKYDDSLFLFNDNEEQFLEHIRDPASEFGCAAGGGNAVIRPFQCQMPPRAAGIPTGAHGVGYAELSDEVKATIDQAIAGIRDLLAFGRYRRAFFSADEQGRLGTGIFEVDDEVKDYIVSSIKALAE